MTKKKDAKKDKPAAGNWYAAYAKRRNAKRREEYAANAAYREKAIQQSRAAYREKAGVNPKDCRDNLPLLDQIGKIRLVKQGKAVKKMLTFTSAELAAALGYSLIAVYRMQKDGRLPKPIKKLVYEEGAGAGGAEFVYLKPELSGMLAVIGAHQENVAHYRVSHTETRSRLYMAVQKARKGN